MKRLLAFLLLLAPSAWGAVGDILSAAVETNGWVLRIEISGGTNQMFFNGFGPNNTVGTSNNLTVDVTSMGFDDTGTQLYNVGRKVRGTALLRRPYAEQAVWDVLTNDGAGASTMRIALSEFVFSRDSNITVSIRAAAFTNGAVNSAAATGLAVTNLSTQPYPRPVGNWSWPGNQLETNATMRLRAVAFGGSAQLGRPIRVMRFIATGATSGISVTNHQTQMMIDRTLPDPIPTGEYVADIALAGFTDNELLRCDFQAFPWVGDTALNTADGVNIWPTNTYCQITNRCDPDNDWSRALAVVALDGNDTNGRATNNVDPTQVQAAHYFASIGKAASEIVATNNALYGHASLDGGTVYVRAGVTNWGAEVAGNIGLNWLHIVPYPGESVSLTNAPTSQHIGHDAMVHFKGITFSGPANLLYLEHNWFDQCRFDSSAAAFLQDQYSAYFTHCAASNITQGLIPYGAAPMYHLIRGCNLDGSLKKAGAMVMMGNSHPASGALGGGFIWQGDISVKAPADGGIFYNNKIFGTTNTAASLGTINNTNMFHGYAMIQNVWEHVSGTNTGFNIGINNSFQFTNFLVWNNVLLGFRIMVAYNDAGSAPAYRYLWTYQNNIVDDFNIKADVLVGSPDAARIGNWPVIFGAGCYGNVHPETTNVGGAAGGFMQEFSGLNYLGGTAASGSSDGSTTFIKTTNYLRFVSRQAFDGATFPMPGNGNYRHQSDAPQNLTPGAWVLPFDIEGLPRSLSDPPGAYASGNVRKGAFF